MQEELKYLGLTLDGRLTFDKHFDRLIPKLEGVAASLGRLLSNIGGPNDRVRRLYTGVINSMILYGSPCWSQPLTDHAKRIMRRLQRRMAIRISYDAATDTSRFNTVRYDRQRGQSNLPACKKPPLQWPRDSEVNSKET